MNGTHPETEDGKLRQHLRNARPSPALPPQFGEHVWRRIEATSDLAAPASAPSWQETLAALILRPRVAIAAASVLMVTGALLGARGNPDFAHKDAQIRYVAAVVPHALH